MKLYKNLKINKIKNMITIIDPPSGWKYGFPKPIPKDRIEDVLVWLVEQGYPQSEIDGLGEIFTNCCRYWEQEEQTNKTVVQELLEFCEYRQTKAADGCKAAWNMILARIKDDGLLEREKEQIMNAFWYGDNTDCLSEQNSFEFAEQYYNKTFKNK
jgi:hypothetical protein